MTRRRHRLLIAAAAAAVAGVVPSTARATLISFASSKDNTLYEDMSGSLSNGAGG